MKYFKELIKGYNNFDSKNITKECLNTKIKNIAYNSKLIKKDYIFVAIKGTKDDGHKYIENAIENKANIIIYDFRFDKKKIKELKNKNYKCVCFSGGFKNATLIFVEKLKLDGEFSNIFHTKNNILTGKVGGEMMFSDSKGNMLLALQKLLNISYNDTLVVGDGANDLSMFKYAKNRVAFCSKEILKKEANIIINEKDLRLLIDKI